MILMIIGTKNGSKNRFELELGLAKTVEGRMIFDRLCDKIVAIR